MLLEALLERTTDTEHKFNVNLKKKHQGEPHVPEDGGMVVRVPLDLG